MVLSSRDKNDPGLPGGKERNWRDRSFFAGFFFCRVQSFRVSQSSATEVRLRCESGEEEMGGGWGRTRGTVMEQREGGRRVQAREE